MWMNLENLTLSERSRSQMAIYCVIPFILNVQNRQIYKTESGSVVARGWGQGKWEVTANGSGVFGGEEWIAAMVVPLCECTQNH